MSARSQPDAESFFVRAKPVVRKTLAGIGAFLLGQPIRRSGTETHSISSGEHRWHAHRQNQIDHARQGARWMV